MALAKFMAPRPGMTLYGREETRDEGYKPGIKMFQGETPDQAILLNATYNNYTITNHYRSKEQIETNDRLQKENKALRVKYDTAKKLLSQMGPLVKHIPLDTLDIHTRKNVTQFNLKWQHVVAKKNEAKRKRGGDDSSLSSSIDEDQKNFKRPRY